MKYVAFFRGINVGGKNVVKMNDLMQLLQDLGLYKVKTYIQSGNSVFESDLQEEYLKDVIRLGFRNHFGFEVNLMIRSVDEIETLIVHFPFTKEEIDSAEAADSKVEHIHVYFLDYIPEQIQIKSICEAFAGSDILRAGGRELYLLCHQSIRKSKLAIRTAKEFELATVRNWNTVNKLYDMLKEK